MKLYAYCLSDELVASTLESVTGIAGARPYLIEHEGIAAVVSEFVGDLVPVTKDNVFAHERVVGQVLAQATPLPFRFGSLIAGPELEKYLGGQEASLREMLERVRGCVEMGIKIMWDPAAIKSQIESEPSSSLHAGKGTAFLMARRSDFLADKVLKVQAQDIVAWQSARIGELVRASEIKVRPERKI